MHTSEYTYSSDFFDYIEYGSQSSAQVIIDLLLKHLPIQSVLDVGCGRGVWLQEWLHQGVKDVAGVDGDYISPEVLHIPQTLFFAENLTKPLDLDRKFDLVQSLEVAEHIPTPFSEIFVKSLVDHGDMILFSAAPPGQGGKFHINEQNYSYWRNLFAQHNYHLIDWIRPMLSRCPDLPVEPWYRYNTLFFVNGDIFDILPSTLQGALIKENMPIKDYGSLPWKIRRLILKNLPNSIVASLVTLKHTFVLKSRSFQSVFTKKYL